MPPAHAASVQPNIYLPKRVAFHYPTCCPMTLGYIPRLLRPPVRCCNLPGVRTTNHVMRAKLVSKIGSASTRIELNAMQDSNSSQYNSAHQSFQSPAPSTNDAERIHICVTTHVSFKYEIDTNARNKHDDSQSSTAHSYRRTGVCTGRAS